MKKRRKRSLKFDQTTCEAESRDFRLMLSSARTFRFLNRILNLVLIVLTRRLCARNTLTLFFSLSFIVVQRALTYKFKVKSLISSIPIGASSPLINHSISRCVRDATTENANIRHEIFSTSPDFRSKMRHSDDNSSRELFSVYIHLFVGSFVFA